MKKANIAKNCVFMFQEMGNVYTISKHEQKYICLKKNKWTGYCMFRDKTKYQVSRTHYLVCSALGSAHELMLKESVCSVRSWPVKKIWYTSQV